MSSFPLQLTTLRGSILEEAIPSTSRHGAARALPAKDILEHVVPELQLPALRMAQPGVKVIVTQVQVVQCVYMYAHLIQFPETADKAQAAICMKCNGRR